MAGNQLDDNILEGATPGNSVSGGIQGLILQQLKINTIILRQGFNITDEDATFLKQPVPVLNPPATPTSPTNL